MPDRRGSLSSLKILAKGAAPSTLCLLQPTLVSFPSLSLSPADKPSWKYLAGLSRGDKIRIRGGLARCSTRQFFYKREVLVGCIVLFFF